MGAKLKYLAAAVLSLQIAACSVGQPASLVPNEPALPSNTAMLPSHQDFLGCPYPSGSVWNTDVSRARVSPTSAANIKATIDAGGGGPFTAAVNPTSEYVNSADSSTPRWPVHPLDPNHMPKSPEPWKFTPPFYIEPFTDAHAMVLRTDSCTLYETYGTVAEPLRHRLSAVSGTFVNLNRPFVRPDRGACSTATCIPIALVAIRPEELSAGVIRHAIGWDGVKHSVSRTACVSPAAVTHCTDGMRYDGPPNEKSNAMPYGAHIRLKAGFKDASFPREARIAAEALKHYGAYLFDTGCCNTIPFIDDVHGTPRWTLADDAALRSIQLANFDVVLPP